ncbi:MAG: serine hydrolase [Eubacteriales bacterium]|nr:serine hydrolase [Eubacteriales bacterium]
MAEYMLETGASGRAVEEFFRANGEIGNLIEGVVVWKGGKVLAKAAPEPYSVYDKGELYSLSKSFCSTAVGMLIAEGKMRLDERIAAIFPKEAEGGDEGLRQATVRDLLTMRTGHAACVMPALSRSLDPIRAFFRQETAFAPGERFAYNTAATYMLSAAVQKKTGMTVQDYLEPRLFEPLGIRGQSWGRCAGVSEGGIGLHLSADDIWRLGVLYLQGGVWEGRRLLTEEWVRDAQTPHADNSMNGTPDWCAGYGYQFWNNAGDGFRGDGAFGQLCMVLPEKNAVVAVRALVQDMQREVELVQKLAEEIDRGGEGEGALPAHAPLAGGECGFAGLYRCERNEFGWTQLRIEENEGELILRMQDGERAQEMHFGAGKWADTAFWAKRYCPKLVGLQDNLYREEIRFAGSWEQTQDGARMLCRYRSTPHVEQIALTLRDGRLEMRWSPEELRAKRASVLKAERIGG